MSSSANPNVMRTRIGRVEPPIPFDRPAKVTYKKSDGVTFTCHTVPGDHNSEKFELFCPFFSTGSCENLLHVLKVIERVIVSQNLTTGPQRYALIRRVLEGDALAAFEQAAASHGNETNDHFASCLEDLKTHVFPARAYAIQRRYMRRHMRKPRDVKIREYLARFNELNELLSTFPGAPFDPKVSDDEICDILEYGAPGSWQNKMREHDFDPLLHSPIEVVEFCERLETNEDIEGASKPPPKVAPSPSRKRRRDTKDTGSRRDNETGGDCLVHGDNTHSSHRCFVLKEEAKRLKREYQAKMASRKGGFEKKSDRRPPKPATREIHEFEESIDALVSERVEAAVTQLLKRKLSNVTDLKDEDLDQFNFENLSLEQKEDDRKPAAKRQRNENKPREQHDSEESDSEFDA